MNAFTGGAATEGERSQSQPVAIALDSLKLLFRLLPNEGCSDSYWKAARIRYLVFLRQLSANLDPH